MVFQFVDFPRDSASTDKLTSNERTFRRSRRFIIMGLKIMVFRSTGPENHSLIGSTSGGFDEEICVSEIWDLQNGRCTGEFVSGVRTSRVPLYVVL